MERVLERRLGVFFAEEQVDRLRASKLDEGAGPHGWNRTTPSLT